MATNYDALYHEQPNALGAPTRSVVAACRALGIAGASVLDLGCGQGRDALWLAREGARHVHGVDLSPAGIEAMLAAARAETLEITGEVADLGLFAPAGAFDILLCDRVLHMMTGPARADLLRRTLPELRLGCVIADEKRNYPAILDTVREIGGWEIIEHARAPLVLRRQGGSSGLGTSDQT